MRGRGVKKKKKRKYKGREERWRYHPAGHRGWKEKKQVKKVG